MFTHNSKYRYIYVTKITSIFIYKFNIKFQHIKMKKSEIND